MNAGPKTTMPRRKMSRNSPVRLQSLAFDLPWSNPVATHRMPRWKLLGDYVLAVLLFLFTLPLLGLAMLAVRLSSRGPAIYTQERLGLHGQPFTIYKLRTMYLDCESLTGPRWALPGDPRITPVGNILRKLHLDELPQLWNVLRGDMSLIGPRPERPAIVVELRKAIPNYDVRHLVKPGITGYAQIHLPPDTNLQSVKNKVAYDRFYIRRRSFLFELYILLCTGLKVVHAKGWYRRPPRKPTDEV